MKKRLICMVLVVIAALVMAACSSKSSENTDNNAPAGGNKTENVTEAPTPAEENKTENVTEAPTPAEENKTDNITEAPTPAEENNKETLITDTDQAELTLVPGRYYDISTFDEYVEITEDLSFEMWGYAENDFVCLNTGYLEKKDAAGVYIVHSESVYVDEVIEPFEIFMTEEGVIDWNGFIFCYSE